MITYTFNILSLKAISLFIELFSIFFYFYFEWITNFKSENMLNIELGNVDYVYMFYIKSVENCVIVAFVFDFNINLNR